MDWILYHFVRLIAKNWYEKCEITIENKALEPETTKMYNNVECELAIKSSGMWECLALVFVVGNVKERIYKIGAAISYASHNC